MLIEWQMTTTPVESTCCLCDRPFTTQSQVAVGYHFGERYGEVCPVCAALSTEQLRAQLRRKVAMLRLEAEGIQARAALLERMLKVPIIPAIPQLPYEET